MRCFIAIDLPDEVMKELNNIQKQLPTEDTKLLNVKPEIMHLTLRFLGEIDGEKVNEIKLILDSLRIKQFRAKLSNIGIFPDENFIRVVWVGLEPREKFKEIHDLIENGLSKIKIEGDSRFESHVTLSRVKFVKDRKIFIEKLKKIEIKPIEFNVDNIKLKMSTLTSNGPVYNDLFSTKTY